ncbi:MAG TPA: hypothetical protein VN616_06405 [Puia sp.]|nr:hypothetical protein [Puia sp.]
MTLKILPAVIVAGAFLLYLPGCAKDNAVASGGTCDTANVRYSTQVVDILQDYCYGCHKGPGAASGIDFSSYGAFSGWAKTPFVLADITAAPGYTPMPYGGPPLDSCQINTIAAWIHQGMPNN